MYLKKLTYAKLFTRGAYYNAEGAGAAASGGAAGDGNAGGASGGGAGAAGESGLEWAAGDGQKIKFTPEQQTFINTKLAEDKRKLKTVHEQTIRELENIKKRAGTTEAEKKILEDRIESLTSQHLTQEEIRQREYKKTTETLSSQLKETETKAESATRKYQQYLIRGEISQAAADLKGRASQLVQMFGASCKVVPALDADGKETGHDKVLMTVTLNGKQLEASPAEILKTLKESDDYANLFSFEGSGGVGGSQSRGTAPIDVEKLLAGSPDDYAKNRAKILAAFNKPK